MPTEPRLYYLLGGDGRPYGPARPETVRQWLRDGRLTAQSQINVVGTPDWEPLVNLPEFAADLAPAPPPVAPPTPVYAAPRHTHPLAVAGFICGLISLTCCACCGGQVFAFTGLVLSILGLVETSRHPDRYEGRALAIAGIVLSGLGMVLGWVGMGAGFAASLADGGHAGRWR
jgi:hypothetical protein